MKLWTMLAGLTLAGILASSVFAQTDDSQAPKKKGRGGMALQWKDFGLDDSATLDQATYLKTALSKLPETADKDQATPRIQARYAAIVKAAGVTDDAASAKLTKAQYEDGLKKLPARGKKKKSADQ